MYQFFTVTDQKTVDEMYLKRGSQPFLQFLQLDVDHGQKKNYRRSSFNKFILKISDNSIQPSLRNGVDRKREKITNQQNNLYNGYNVPLNVENST